MGLLFSLAVALPRAVHLGHMRLPAFGLIATAGLLAAMSLGRHTALRAGLHADRVWDAGVVATAGAFGLSRVLLVLSNWRLFCREPLLVLSSPWFSPYVLLATAGLLVWWLRWKGIPTLRLADAWSAPAMLLLAMLQLGHFVEGTDGGMPTSLPWGVHDYALGRVHPVQLYAAAGYGVLCMWFVQRASDTGRPGHLAANALVAAGVLSFFLDFVRQPYQLLGDAWLDPGQYLALLCAAAGAVLLLAPLELYAEHPPTAALRLAEESR